MRLWGRVATGLSLLIAAVFAVVAVAAPETQPASLVAAALLAAVALVGVPALVRLFSSVTGDEAVLESGRPGSATITALQRTGWRYNRRDPIVKLGLRVEAGGVWPVEVRQVVPCDVGPTAGARGRGGGARGSVEPQEGRHRLAAARPRRHRGG